MPAPDGRRHRVIVFTTPIIEAGDLLAITKHV